MMRSINYYFARKSRMHYEYHTRREHTIERIVLNMLETHRNIRELAEYYHVPKSTLYDWLCSAEKYLPYDLYDRMCNELDLHRRKQCNIWQYGDCFYYTSDVDGPLD